MAGDWIPITSDLPRRREVLLIAASMGMPVRDVVGALVEFWGWASRETSDGFLRHINVATLVRLFALPDTFWRAMISVDWLREAPDGLLIPNWQRWLSNSAKARMGNALRQKIRRHKTVENVATNVATCVATKARPQKSTVQKSITTTPKSPSDGHTLPPNLDTPEFRTAWSDWLQHRREIHKPATPTSQKRTLAKLSKWGMGRALAAVEHSTEKGWQGIFEPKEVLNENSSDTEPYYPPLKPPVSRGTDDPPGDLSGASPAGPAPKDAR